MPLAASFRTQAPSSTSSSLPIAPSSNQALDNIPSNIKSACSRRQSSVFEWPKHPSSRLVSCRSGEEPPQPSRRRIAECRKSTTPAQKPEPKPTTRVFVQHLTQWRRKDKAIPARRVQATATCPSHRVNEAVGRSGLAQGHSLARKVASGAPTRTRQTGGGVACRYLSTSSRTPLVPATQTTRSPVSPTRQPTEREKSNGFRSKIPPDTLWWRSRFDVEAEMP